VPKRLVIAFAHALQPKREKNASYQRPFAWGTRVVKGTFNGVKGKKGRGKAEKGGFVCPGKVYVVEGDEGDNSFRFEGKLERGKRLKRGDREQGMVRKPPRVGLTKLEGKELKERGGG